jgi:hypothetical protein
MPIPRLIASPVLDPKNIEEMSLPHEVISCHVSQLTQARIIDPEAVRNKPAIFGKRWLRPSFTRIDSFDNFIFSTIFQCLNFDLFEPYLFELAFLVYAMFFV